MKPYQTNEANTYLAEEITSYVGEVQSEYNLTSTSKISRFSDFFRNKMLVVHSIRMGVPFTLYNEIQKTTPFTEDEWAEFLNISLKTLQRNRKEKGFRFKPIHSEKILELAEVNEIGAAVFDSREQFHQWLKTPVYALGNELPYDLLKDSYGKELVLDELNRIENGVFA
ncbi:MAG: DUF2384 domain-containing protein [Bacteroidetes bacterium]|nr:DUF2384 domain-containing protein [Bacteroidota bacterium]